MFHLSFMTRFVTLVSWILVTHSTCTPPGFMTCGEWLSSGGKVGRMRTRVESEKLRNFQLVLAPGVSELGGPDGQPQVAGASWTWL